MRKYILLISAVLLMFSTASHAQSSKATVIENRILNAVHMYNQGDFEQAESILTGVLEADDTYDAAWYYLAMIAMSDQDYESVRKFLDKALSLDPGNFWYRYSLAALHARNDELNLALEHYEKLMEDFPKKSELYYEMAELYLNNGDFKKAVSTAQEIERVFGMSEPLTLFQYRVAYLSGNKEEAINSLQRYNSQYSSPQILYLLAQNEMSELNDSTAMAYYDEALELDSSFVPALLGKAEIYALDKRYDEFFPVLYSYLKTEGDDVAEKSDYVLKLINSDATNLLTSFSDELDMAVEILYELYPGEMDMYFLKGWYSYVVGRDEEAMLAFRESILMNFGDPVAYAYLLDYLMKTEQWEELSREGRVAFSCFPDEFRFMQTACYADYCLEHYDKMLEGCRTILKKADDEEVRFDTWSAMGDVYHQIGESRKAYKAYDEALKIKPDDAFVLNNYAYYLSLENRNLKKAYEMSRKTVEMQPENESYLDTFGWILFLQGKPQEAKPLFKKAMLLGGKDNAVILDHYAEVLYALEEYDLAFVYWNLALQKDNGDVPGLKDKVDERRQNINR